MATLGVIGLLSVTAAGAARPAPLRLVRIAVDTTSVAEAQHATVVEPDAAAFGTRVVATFQTGRYFGGSAGAIGFAASTNAGHTWQSGLLPGTPPAPGDRASDPVIAYDSLHRRWLIATLVNTPTASSLFVSASADGVGWGPPVTATAYERNPDEGTLLDKEWLACDNGAASSFRGRCYLAYTDAAHDVDPRQRGSNLAVQSSSDGGVTWSAPVLLPIDAQEVSPAVQPVVRPSGELVIVFFEDAIVQAVRSSDGGVSFAGRQQVSRLTSFQHRIEPSRLRAFSLPTATVDRAGTVYAAWPDCRFRATCTRNDIVWSSSSAAGRWTPPRRIPLAPLRATSDLVLPELAADPSSTKRLALTYYVLNSAGCTEATCRLDVYLVTSTTAGRRWTRPRRLNAQRMRLPWLAQTASGRMVGDYSGTVFTGSRIVSVHVQARAPQAGVLNEAAYAASVPRP